MNIEDIADAIRLGRVRVTDHAHDEAEKDQLSYDDIFVSVFQGEVIEDYPDDMPYPSCLIYGSTFNRESIHSVWAYNQETRSAVLVTVYRPDKNRWLDWITRRRM